MNLFAGFVRSLRRFLRAGRLALPLVLSVAAGIGAYTVLEGFVRGLTHPGPALFPKTRGLLSISPRPGPIVATEGLLTGLELREALQSAGDLKWKGVVRISRGLVTQRSGGPSSGADSSSIVTIAEITPEIAAIFHLPELKTAIASDRLFHQEYGAKPPSDLQINWSGGDRHSLSVAHNTAAPPNLEGIYSGFPVDIWAPLEFTDNESGPERRQYWLFVERPLVRALPTALQAMPYTGILPGAVPSLSRIEKVLRAASTALLLVACTNVALFLLTLSFTRSREYSLCIALGAGRWQMARDVIIDSINLSIMGAAAGSLLAFWLRKVLPAFLYEEDASRLSYSINLETIAWVAAGGAVVTLLCGLTPLLAIPHQRPAAILQREAAGPSAAMQKLQSTLLVVQMASCLVLAISTGFLWNNLTHALRTTAGHRLTGEPVFATMQTTASAGPELFRAAEHLAFSMPLPIGGPATRVAWTNYLPGSRGEWETVHFEPRGLPLRDLNLMVTSFTADSLQDVAVPPKAGRLFSRSDENCPSVVVNQEAAELLFGDETAGRTLQSSHTGILHTIIGVVRSRRGGTRVPLVYHNGTGQTATKTATYSPAQFRAATREAVEQSSRSPRASLERFVVSNGYFEAMGFSLVAGRWPAGVESSEAGTGCRVAVINQQAANLYFPRNDAVGASMIDSAGRRTRIVGVVSAAAAGAFQRALEPAVYYPLAQDFSPRMSVHMITAIPPGRARGTSSRQWTDRLSGQLESLPGAAAVSVKSLDQHLQQTALAPLRITLVLVGATALATFVLILLGLHGALEDMVRRRRREIAIRIALGARRRHVMQLILSAGFRLAAAGTVAGLAATIAVWYSALSGAHSEWPPLWCWLAGPVILPAAVALSSMLPVRQASLTNPLRLMREENPGGGGGE